MDVANTLGGKEEVMLECGIVLEPGLGINQSCQVEAVIQRTIPPPDSSPVQTWFSPYSLCHHLLFSPVDAFPACLLAAWGRCLPGKLGIRESYYQNRGFEGEAFQGLSQDTEYCSHQGQALKTN